MQQPYNNQFQQQQQHGPPGQPQWQTPPPKPRRRRRFRWELFIALPLFLLAIIWIYKSIELGFSWDELLDKWRIHNKERFTTLAVLGVLACCVCAIARILRGNKKDE